MKQGDFEALIQRWLQQNIISAEQAQYMTNDVRESTSEQSGKKFIAVVATVGASVLLAGVLLVIASNWAFLGKPIQLLLALFMPVAPISIAYYLIEARQSPSILGKVANIFGIGLIGGSLALIGQIYNLESGYTTLVSLWALLSIPFVFVFKRAENVVLSAFLVGMAFLVTLIELFNWSDEEAFALTLTVAALAYAGFAYFIGVALRHSTVWGSGARALRLMSASVASTTLFFTTFEFYARIVTGSSRGDVTWVPISIVFNLVFIGFLVFVLFKAFRYQEERLAVSVVRLMFLYVVVKYFTLFSDMLETGALLMFGGILFITGAWYLEKNKKRLLSLMRQEIAPPQAQSQFTPHMNSDTYE